MFSYNFTVMEVFCNETLYLRFSYLLKCLTTQRKLTDIVDGLYWKFIDDERDKLKKSRLGIMIKVLDNMKLRKNKIAVKQKVLANLLHKKINSIG